MVRLSDVARPGLMISQTWPTSREQQGQTLTALELAVAEDFFEAYQTVEVPFAEERRAIAKLVNSAGVPLNYCLTRVLNENRLNLSDLDDANRQRSYERIIEALDDAREVGASAVSVVSGPRPAGPSDRKGALDRLAYSLLRICEAAARPPSLQVVIEPLDMDADKRLTLGTTHEAVALCEKLAGAGHKLLLTLDMAHMLLNGEDPVACLAVARQHTAEYHFCNPVLDPSHPKYGDKHLHFGPPGPVDISGISRVMRAAVAMGFLTRAERPGLFCEVLRPAGEDSVALMRYCRQVMVEAWQESLEHSGN